MFERILLAVDGSEPAHRAADLAAGMGKLGAAEVLVLHVHEHDVSWRFTVPKIETDDAAAQVEQQVVDLLQAQGLKASGKVLTAVAGNAAKAIVAEAEAWPADTIVLGTRGRSELTDLLVGSVAHGVLNHAHVPVIVVR